MPNDDLKTTQLILDLTEMLRVYVDGKDHNETRGQALATIREANEWLYGEKK